jgi:endonuclease III
MTGKREPRRVSTVIQRLRKMYGEIDSPRLSPFELILLENASYLVDDDRRWEVFRTLRETVGVSPDAILARSAASLAAVIAEGGMKPMMRAEKVLACARIATEIGIERLDRAIQTDDPAAKKLLRRFPGIGEPSADKILLLCGSAATLAPDSNALRVLTRLGYATEQKNYAQTYRLAMAATSGEIANLDTARAAHLLLRRHGQETCKRNAPRCEICPLRSLCRWYGEAVGG